MTRQPISTVRQPPLHYFTRSVRRTSGFVLARHPPTILGKRQRTFGLPTAELAGTWVY